jgi:hypothetical protein
VTDQLLLLSPYILFTFARLQMAALSEKQGMDSPEQVSHGSQEHIEHLETENNIKEKDDLEAVKGDDSDGQIDWSVRQVLACSSLALLYVGMCHHLLRCHKMLMRVPSGSQIPLYFTGGSLAYMTPDVSCPPEECF